MECIITNLEEDAFPMEETKRLYGWRWGIERSFREPKYMIGLTNFHSKECSSCERRAKGSAKSPS